MYYVFDFLRFVILYLKIFGLPVFILLPLWSLLYSEFPSFQLHPLTRIATLHVNSDILESDILRTVSHCHKYNKRR